MKIISQLCFFLFSFHFTIAQSLPSENLWNGTGKFILETEKAAFDPNIKLTSGDTLGQNKTYGYDCIMKPDSAILFLGIPVNTILLSFNEKDKLRGFTFIIQYNKTDSTDYSKESIAGIKKIILYLKEKLKTKALLTNVYKATNASTINYQWTKKGKEVLFSTVEGKIPGREFIELSISFGYALY